MSRVIVVGNPWTRRSEFSTALSTVTGIPMSNVDELLHGANAEEVVTRIGKAVEPECWIMDGPHVPELPHFLERCDSAIFLDYSLEECMENSRRRLAAGEFVTASSMTHYFMSLRPLILDAFRSHPRVMVNRFTSHVGACTFLKALGWTGDVDGGE